MGFPEDRISILSCVKDHSTPDPTVPNQAIFTPPEKHSCNLIESDFATFSFGEKKYDVIIALNSVFYLLNNPKFEQQYHYPFFAKLINSLKIGGNLFFDKITHDILRQWKENGIDNISVKNLGGFPNFMFRITRIN